MTLLNEILSHWSWRQASSSSPDNLISSHWQRESRNDDRQIQNARKSSKSSNYLSMQRKKVWESSGNARICQHGIRNASELPGFQTYCDGSEPRTSWSARLQLSVDDRAHSTAAARCQSCRLTHPRCLFVRFVQQSIIFLLSNSANVEATNGGPLAE